MKGVVLMLNKYGSYKPRMHVHVNRPMSRSEKPNKLAAAIKSSSLCMCTRAALYSVLKLPNTFYIPYTSWLMYDINLHTTTLYNSVSKTLNVRNN